MMLPPSLTAREAARQLEIVVVERAIRAYLRRHSKPRRTPKGYHYAGLPAFLLKHGRFFPPQPRPSTYRQAEPENCYQNCARLTKRRGLRYVEGVAFGPRGSNLAPNADARRDGWSLSAWEAPVHHAWCLDGAGRVVDPTWPAAATGICAYFGVVLPTPLAVELARRLGRREQRAWVAWWLGDLSDRPLFGSGGVLDDGFRGWPILKHPFTED